GEFKALGFAGHLSSNRLPQWAHSFRGTLLWPVRLRRLTSRYGWRGRSFHEGVDIGVPSNTKVRAAHRGRVVFAGRVRGYGNLVVVKGRGIMTVYAHNRRLVVRRGQHVKRGALLAFSGLTGKATGPHLHFETRLFYPAIGYVAVNPLLLF
ncbi:MAG: M23 family metallopeptidase, partial [Candidatus Dadabacteria bacterium]